MKRTPLLILVCLTLLSFSLFHFEPSKAKNKSSNNQQDGKSRLASQESTKSVGANSDPSGPEKGISAPANPNQDQKSDITVVASYQNDTSIPLRKMKPRPVVQETEHEANENPKIPVNHQDSPDPVVQDR